MMICKAKGKETLYTFLDVCDRILGENYVASGLSKDSIVDMAATIIADEIKCKIYDTNVYPTLKDFSNDSLIPPSLSRLLNHMIKSKSSSAKSVERRRTSIAHSIISAVRPRSFISPLLLAISVYINTID